MKKIVSSALTGVLCLSLAACSSGTSSTDSSTDSSTSGDNRLVLAKENDVISMDSTYATDGMSFEMIAATIDGLMSLDEDGSPIPAIAESYEISDDNLTYTFTLRDAEWSDGTPVTANDFVFAWNYTVTNPEAEYSYLFTKDGACIKNADEIVYDQDDSLTLGVSATDDKTLVVELSTECPYFLSLMAFPVFFPINEEFFNAQDGSYGLNPENLLANGPFVLTSWTKGTSLSFDKNETYWDADTVQIDGIDVNIVPEVSTSALDFENGNTDFTRLNSTLIDKYQDDDEFATYLEGYLWYLQFNLDNEYLSNENLRKAISTVVDRTDLVENVLKDGSVATGNFVPTEFAAGPDGTDYTATATKFFDAVGDDALAAANEYWEKAKEELGVDSITLSLLYEPSDPAKPAAEYIQSCIQKLDGITIEMVSQEKSARIEKQKSHDFDIVLTRWGPDYADPTTYLNLMITGNAYNYGNYSSEEYDAKMAEAAAADTAEERWTLLHEAEEILLNDAPVVGVFQTGGASLVSSNVTGIQSHTFGTPWIYKYVVKTEE